MARTNIAFAGLTAAGKTTHARLLAQALGYRYVSATEILLEILGIDGTAERVWFTQSGRIWAAREGDAADEELERRLLEMARTNDGIVFDTWALAWIADSPMVRVWIESDTPSRSRKCYVSQGRRKALSVQACTALVEEKDELTRASFLRRHGFDIAYDRERYDVQLDNSQLIPSATDRAAKAGIAQFAPVIEEVVRSKLELLPPGPSARIASDDGVLDAI